MAEAFAKAYGYQATIPGPNGTSSRNPETRAEFMRQRMMDFVRNTVKSVEVASAAETARMAEMAKTPVTVS